MGSGARLPLTLGAEEAGGGALLRLHRLAGAGFAGSLECRATDSSAARTRGKCSGIPLRTETQSTGRPVLRRPEPLPQTRLIETLEVLPHLDGAPIGPASGRVRNSETDERGYCCSLGTRTRLRPGFYTVMDIEKQGHSSCL